MQFASVYIIMHHPVEKQVLLTYEYMILTSYDTFYILSKGHMILQALHILLLNQDANPFPFWIMWGM